MVPPSKNLLALMSKLFCISIVACTLQTTFTNVAIAQPLPPTLESHCPYVPALESFRHANSLPKDHWGEVIDLKPAIIGPKKIGRTSQYLIIAPSVRSPQTSYPTILMRPGDIVSTRACGCVQTGGTGKTWKRYVNPTGKNSGSLYHGLIGLGHVHFLSTDAASPSTRSGFAIGTFFRIGDWIAFNKAGGKAFATEDRPLSLGYEDDDYDDNGYWGFDGGTDDQCLNEGAAVVEITVRHTMASLEENTDRHGSDISATPLRIPTAGRCAALCAVNPACKAMTFVPDHTPTGGACWLKRSIPNPRHAEGGISSFKISP
jgi:hypothetical protein